MASGVYCLQSKIKPERIYIGSSYNMMKRRGQHYSELKRNRHENAKIKNHTNKYGYDDLEFFVVSECGVDELISCEQFYIDILDPYFNVRKIANSNRGIKQDEIVVEKRSKKSIERWKDLEYRDNIVFHIRKRSSSFIYKEKLSESHTGLAWSKKRHEANSKIIKNKGKSMFWGIGKSKNGMKFSATVTINSKTKRLGTFDTELQAAIGREHYILFHGMEYQKLNNVSSSGE